LPCGSLGPLIGMAAEPPSGGRATCQPGIQALRPPKAEWVSELTAATRRVPATAALPDIKIKRADAQCASTMSPTINRPFFSCAPVAATDRLCGVLGIGKRFGLSITPESGGP